MISTRHIGDDGWGLAAREYPSAFPCLLQLSGETVSVLETRKL